MTTAHTKSASPSIAGPAIGTTVLTVLVLLWAYYVDSPWKAVAHDWGIDGETGVAGLLWIGGFVVIAVGVVYDGVVRRSLAGDPSTAARTALILAIVAVPLAIVAYWTGLPIVLGSAAAYLGLNARAQLGRTPATAGIAIGLGLLVAAFAAYLCITG